MPAPEVSFSYLDFSGLNFSERREYGRDLARAVRQTPQLPTELPLVAEGYRTSWRAARRMAQQARKTSELRALLIKDGSVAIGVGSIHTGRPDPDMLPEGSAVELAYWHASKDEATAIAYGRAILGQLYKLGQLTPFRAEVAWTVTLPEDRVKRAVCDETGFLPVEEPRVYQLQDDVTIPRQLWARVA